jgi:hypothetical protein
MSIEFWLSIHNIYDNETARDELGKRLEIEVTPAENDLA